MAIKVDIKKVFDMLDWKFLLKVLSQFGFHAKFCDWISVLLHSTKLSILVNGKVVGFFNCKKGVRQEFLRRGISKLVNYGNLYLMDGPRNFSMPSHALYANDVLIFCRGSLENFRILKSLFLFLVRNPASLLILLNPNATLVGFQNTWRASLLIFVVSLQELLLSLTWVFPYLRGNQELFICNPLLITKFVWKWPDEKRFISLLWEKCFWCRVSFIVCLFTLGLFLWWSLLRGWGTSYRLGMLIPKK